MIFTAATISFAWLHQKIIDCKKIKMNYSQVKEISGPSIKIDRRREEPREVRVGTGE